VIDMKQGSLLLAATALLLSGCAQHSKGYDGAFAECQNQAIEQWETAGLPETQHADWQDRFINSCMQKKGFK
jgi:starvation-inducible outer membrane lipoprotein